MKNITYINAGAGSGKTYTLTTTLVELIKKGSARPGEVILTTFTTKAAAEFKEKVKEFLFQAGLTEAAGELDQAMVGTVHSVCRRFIKKYWFMLGLTPDMEVMPEEDTEFYLSQSLGELPTEAEVEFLQSFARQFDITRFVNFKPVGIDHNFWKDDLRRIIDYSTNYEIEDFSLSKEASIAFVRRFVEPDCHITLSDETLDAMLSEARTYVANNRRITKPQDHYSRLDMVAAGRHDRTFAWYAQVAKFLGAKCGPTCAEVGQRLAKRWNSVEVFEMQQRYITLVFELAARWRQMYARFKRRKNLLDYNDMEKYMLRLLQNKTVAAEIAKSFRYLFVDEFQDSSPMQVKIFDALSELMTHSYWVGDYKQSVYRFRGSDIDLVKAVVDTIATSSEGCDTMTLTKSYRSLPPIVKVCNNVFGKTFADVLSPENIRLEAHRKRAAVDSLRYFYAEKEALASHIGRLLGEGFSFSDIAVIARSNDELAGIACALNKRGIPTSRLNYDLKASKIWMATCALLRVVDSPRDTLGRASAALLLAEGYDTRRILEERIHGLEAGSTDEDFLGEVPILHRAASIRKKLRRQSVGHLVESMVVELNLFDELKRVGDPDQVASVLQTVMNAARAYEAHCVQLNLPASVNGLIEYIENSDLKRPDNPEGIQLHTYHSCKGLQWKAVVLTSLNDHPADAGRLIQREIFGVHFDRVEAPSAANQYPEVFVRLVPRIFKPKETLTPAIAHAILSSEEFKKASAGAVAEANRLLYVGMTRARDVLLLNLQTPGSQSELLQWFRDIGLTDVVPDQVSPDSWDLLATGERFSDFTITEEEDSPDEPATTTFEVPAAVGLRFERTEHAHRERYVSPSSILKDGPILESHNFNIRVAFEKKVDDWSVVGNCMHHIFALMDNGLATDPQRIKSLIAQYGLDYTMKDTDIIIESWKNLQRYLTENYGLPTQTRHELPFRHESRGQIITGEMDYVWETPQGVVLVDFKTCPRPVSDILCNLSEHYAGNYAGQLDAYTAALEADGRKVLARYVYYPVSGLIARIGAAIERDPLKDDVIYVLGVENIDIDDLTADAEKLCFDDGTTSCLSVNELPAPEALIEDINHSIFRMSWDGLSAQGIKVNILSGEINQIHFVVPPYASEGDVKLLFAYLNAVRQKYPHCCMQLNNEIFDEPFVPCQEHFDALVEKRRRNLRNVIDNTHPGKNVALEGLYRNYYVPSLADFPDKTAEEVAEIAAKAFVSAQFSYDSYWSGMTSAVKTPQGEELSVCILTNSYDTFVGPCDKVALYRKDTKKVKLIPTAEFMAQMEGKPYFKKVDARQFILTKMTGKEWRTLFDTLEGQIAATARPDVPRVFVMRWNPAISSSTIEQYRNAIDEYPDGWCSNWSIYEHENARKGDLYVMMRVGEGNAGIVYHGEFESDPYQSKDWRPTGKMRYYVDINCFDATDPDEPPLITTDRLYAEIPGVDWLHGHSGELLCPADSRKLLDILYDVVDHLTGLIDDEDFLGDIRIVI